MRIQEELDKILLPKQYRRNGKNCFLDPYRKRLIEETPEEIVRQRIAKYCEEKLKVPAEYIMLEMPMSKYVPGEKGRADIVIHKKKEDLGVRYYDYANGGGGHFNGLYRLFLIKDCDGESQILSFSMFGTGEATKYDKDNTHRTSYTTFFVAIDKYKVSKAILEYNVDTFVELSGKKALFKHNGRISSLPSGELRTYIAENSELVHIDGNGMELGSLPTDRLLYLDEEEESKFMYAFLEYALMREKFRSKRKR